MRAVIQRVKRAGVKIFPGGAEKGRIGAGLLVLVAVEDSDSSEDAAWLASKICGLRVFEDGDGKMNLSVADIGGGVMAVSQFTLYGNVRKGFRRLSTGRRARKPPSRSTGNSYRCSQKSSAGKFRPESLAR